MEILKFIDSEFIELFFTKNAVWLMPLLLLILKFVYKLFISEKSNFQKVWESILQTPIDVFFVALTLLTGSIILCPTIGRFGLFITLTVLAFIVVVIWKCSPLELTGKKIVCASFLALINYLISVTSLIIIINLL